MVKFKLLDKSINVWNQLPISRIKYKSKYKRVRSSIESKLNIKWRDQMVNGIPYILTTCVSSIKALLCWFILQKKKNTFKNKWPLILICTFNFKNKLDYLYLFKVWWGPLVCVNGGTRRDKNTNLFSGWAKTTKKIN